MHNIPRIIIGLLPSHLLYLRLDLGHHYDFLLLVLRLLFGSPRLLFLLAFCRLLGRGAFSDLSRCPIIFDDRFLLYDLDLLGHLHQHVSLDCATLGQLWLLLLRNGRIRLGRLGGGGSLSW